LPLFKVWVHFFKSNERSKVISEVFPKKKITNNKGTIQELNMSHKVSPKKEILFLLQPLFKLYAFMPAPMDLSSLIHATRVSMKATQ